MEDFSYLDKKYFIDSNTYNCPFCNRNNVPYSITSHNWFDWTREKRCYIFLAKCSFCKKESMHLTFQGITENIGGRYYIKSGIEDIDSYIFHSVPTSFFVLDKRIPEIIRELITEAEGCQKMNYLTGASACTRKAIYEFLKLEQATGQNYDEKIKSLKNKYTEIDPNYFAIMSHICGMSSDNVHEQSWKKWDSPTIKLLLETFKEILYEIKVLPENKRQRSIAIQKLQDQLKKDKKETKE